MKDKYFHLLSFFLLTPQDIAHLVWAAEGVKPTSTLTLTRGFYPHEIEKLLDGCRKCGLCTSSVTSEHFLHVSVGLKREEAQKHHRAPLPLSYQGLARRAGRLYGYPQTAIQGFVEKNSAKEEDVLPRIFTPDELEFFFLFLPFRLSAANWHEEAEVLKRWFEVLKTAAPETYARIMELHRQYNAFGRASEVSKATRS